MGSKASRHAGAGRKLPSPAPRDSGLFRRMFKEGGWFDTGQTETNGMKTAHLGILLLVALLAFSGLAGLVPRSSAAASPDPIKLYGSATLGWGFGPSNLTNPGPPITIPQGATVTFELFSEDGATHTFVIDLDGNGIVPGDSKDANSSAFGGAGNPAVINWTFTASAAPGSYAYFCGVHLSAMKGTLVIQGSSTPPAAPDYTIYAAAVVIIAIVAVVTVVLIRRRPKTPPAQPPAQPPQ